MNIAITQREINIKGWVYDCIQQDWHDFLRHQTIWAIPNTFMPISKLSQSDCLILSGGNSSPTRDRTESLAVELFGDKPIIGVCHGAFFLNRLYGGINGSIKGHLGVDHNIKMESTTHLVNSYHTATIETLADCLEPVAIDDDGTVEAFKHKELPQWGIVWHPERMVTPVLPVEVKEILNV